jgi:hypothetical protein
VKWRTALAASVAIAVVAMPVVALAGADAASAQQPGVVADSERDRGECPLLDGDGATSDEGMEQGMGSAAHQDWLTSAEHSERHSRMHGAEGSVHDGMMSGRIGSGPMMDPGAPNGQMPGHGSMMGTGIGG